MSSYAWSRVSRGREEKYIVLKRSDDLSIERMLKSAAYSCALHSANVIDHVIDFRANALLWSC